MENSRSKYLSSLSVSEIFLFLFLIIFPFHKHIAVFALYALALSILFTGSFTLFKQRIKSDKTLFAMAAIYVLYVLRIAVQGKYSFEIEQKISLFLFPLIFLYATTDWSKIYKKVFFVYITSCVLSILFCYAVGLYRYNATGDSSFLFYYKLSYFIHAGYYAMYLSLAFAAALYFLLFEDFSRKIKMLLLFSIMLLAVGILFLSAKASLIAIVVIALIFIGIYMKSTGQWKKGFLSLIIVAAIALLAYFSLPVLKERIDTFISSLKENPKYSDTTSSRKLIWKRAIDLIAEKPLAGYGGEANNALYASYETHAMPYELEKKYNAHNEFLQIALAIGVVGFILLLYLLVQGFYQSWKSRDLIFLAFLLIVSIGFATESMLETEAGIIYFCFFYCFLMLSKINTNA